MKFDTSKRDFFGKAGSKIVKTVSLVTTPALASARDFSHEISELSQSLNTKLADATKNLQLHMDELSQRLDAAGLVAASQHKQLLILFILVALLFAIDAGQLLAMLLL